MDNGASSSPYTATAQWQAPAAEATYTVTVNLADSGSFLCGGRQSVAAQLTILVTTSANQPPVIHSLDADPPRVFPNEPSQLTCTASDPDGDPLSYGWSSDSGTVTPGGGETAVFEDGNPGVATVTCAVTDSGGAFTTADVAIAVTSAVAERTLTAGFTAPQKVAVDSMGDLYVADRSAGGITVVHLFSGAVVYRLPAPEVSSIAVDWQDHLLVGTMHGARIVDRAGALLFDLDPLQQLGPVSDVAVDTANHRYAVLHRMVGRVVVYDAAGTIIASFGSNGDGLTQLKGPQGLAFTPSGDLVIADSGHGLIKKFDPSGTLLGSFGGLGAGVGEFVQLADLAVDQDGVVFASDAFQDWVQTFGPDGSPREVFGTFGEGTGEFKTATGVLLAEEFNKLIVASANRPSLEIFRLGGVSPPDEPFPVASLSGTILDFGTQPLGDLSSPLTVSLSNTGTAPLGLRSVTIVGDFAQTNDCGLFLDPGESCTLSVRFAPTVSGTHNGSMQIDTSAENGLLSVDLNGIGIVPPEVVELTPAPQRLIFPEVPVGSWSDPQTVTVTNVGTVPTTIDAVDRIGESPDDFLFDSDLCTGASLGVGESCYFSIVFAPTMPEVRLAEIAIRTASGPDFSVALSGGSDLLFSDGFDSGDLSRWSGTSTATSVTIRPALIDFGHPELGSAPVSRLVTVTNRSDQPVFLGSLGFGHEGGSAFQFVSDRCSGIWLEEGQSCIVEVLFVTVDEGMFSARVEIPVFADDNGERGQVQLKGSVLWPGH